MVDGDSTRAVATDCNATTTTPGAHVVKVPKKWMVGNRVRAKDPITKKNYVFSVPIGKTRGDEFEVTFVGAEPWTRASNKYVNKHVANRKAADTILKNLVGSEYQVTIEKTKETVVWKVVDPETVTDDDYSDASGPESSGDLSPSTNGNSCAGGGRGGRSHTGGSSREDATDGEGEPQNFTGKLVVVGGVKGVVTSPCESEGEGGKYWNVTTFDGQQHSVAHDSIEVSATPETPKPVGINADKSLPKEYTIKELFERLMPIDFQDQAAAVNKVLHDERGGPATAKSRVPDVTVRDIETFWGLIFAGVLSGAKGMDNWHNKDRVFSLKFKFNAIMGKSRFLLIKKNIFRANAKDGYVKETSPTWDRVAKAVSMYMEKRKGFITACQIQVIDEMVSAIRPRTTATGKFC